MRAKTRIFSLKNERASGTLRLCSGQTSGIRDGMNDDVTIAGSDVARAKLDHPPRKLNPEIACPHIELGLYVRNRDPRGDLCIREQTC